MSPSPSVAAGHQAARHPHLLSILCGLEGAHGSRSQNPNIELLPKYNSPRREPLFLQYGVLHANPYIFKAIQLTFYFEKSNRSTGRFDSKEVPRQYELVFLGSEMLVLMAFVAGS